MFGVFRLIRRHVRNAYAAFGIFLLAGAGIAIAFTWAFSEIADRVREGHTQQFDDAVMRWIAAHQYKPCRPRCSRSRRWARAPSSG